MEVSVIESALVPLSAFFEQCITWMGNILSFIAENPFIMVLCFGMPIVGFAFGLLGRLIRL